MVIVCKHFVSMCTVRDSNLFLSMPNLFTKASGCMVGVGEPPTNVRKSRTEDGIAFRTRRLMPWQRTLPESQREKSKASLPVHRISSTRNLPRGTGKRARQPLAPASTGRVWRTHVTSTTSCSPEVAAQLERGQEVKSYPVPGSQRAREIRGPALATAVGEDTLSQPAGRPAWALALALQRRPLPGKPCKAEGKSLDG